MSFFAIMMLAAPAWAGTIHHYGFGVNATAGPLAGESATGTFSYEADPAWHGLRVLGLPFRTLDLTWNGIVYDETEVLWGSAWLDHDGLLDLSRVSSFFGNLCQPGACSVVGDLFTGGHDTWNLELGMPFATWTDGGMGFRYHAIGSGNTLSGLGQAHLRYLGAQPTAVPEPGTGGLLAAGLFCLGWLRRWRAGPQGTASHDRALRRADRLLWEAKANMAKARQLMADHESRGLDNALFHADQHLDLGIEWIADQRRLAGDSD